MKRIEYSECMHAYCGYGGGKSSVLVPSSSGGSDGADGSVARA